MVDWTTMLENWNFGFPYSFLPRFPSMPSACATISTPAISIHALWCRNFPLQRFPPFHFWCSRVFHSRVFSRPDCIGIVQGGGSISAKFSHRRGRSPPIIFARIGQWMPYNIPTFCHNARVWQTDTFLVASPRWHSIQRGKNPQKIASMCWLQQERDRLHQSVCCRHARPSTSHSNGVHGCVQVGANGPE